ncbi:hypothetical protein LY76DRAFT_356489 [Colletotrichum caudatum]|nr:hypothetical protein LY76DRAFT_356489 [Colletotrichum caudatum]
MRNPGHPISTSSATRHLVISPASTSSIPQVPKSASPEVPFLPIAGVTRSLESICGIWRISHTLPRDYALKQTTSQTRPGHSQQEQPSPVPSLSVLALSTFFSSCFPNLRPACTILPDSSIVSLATDQDRDADGDGDDDDDDDDDGNDKNTTGLCIEQLFRRSIGAPNHSHSRLCQPLTLYRLRTANCLRAHKHTLSLCVSLFLWLSPAASLPHLLTLARAASAWLPSLGALFYPPKNQAPD